MILNAHDVVAAAFTRLMSVALSGEGRAGSWAPLFWRFLETVEFPSNLVSCSAPRWWEVHLPSVLLGILIGLLFGPVIETICFWRVALARHLVGGAAAPARPPAERVRPLFRVL